MDNAALIQQITRIKGLVTSAGTSWGTLRGVQAQILEFLAKFAGQNSAFYKTADHQINVNSSITLVATLDNFASYIEAGLANEISPQRQAQLDVVNDLLEQAQSLLNTNSVHPAAPIVLIGATLEEFLRTWIENLGLSMGGRKPSIDSYAQVLMAESLITRQDIKDITSWGGLRNSAAHGKWEEVADKARASLMLEGVNLFMRKYAA
ncbi:hypothetical protein [Polaromonas sp. YR568]|uniref:hypothetical protein n=1 Tax=Polaromonas sp. YR568 TaxID=1855301 RepID=UPI00398BE50C